MVVRLKDAEMRRMGRSQLVRVALKRLDLER